MIGIRFVRRNLELLGRYFGIFNTEKTARKAWLFPRLFCWSDKQSQCLH